MSLLETSWGTHSNMIEKSQTFMSSANETTPLLSAYLPYSRPEANEYVVMCPSCGESAGLHIDGVELENASGDRHRVEAGGETQSSRFDVQQTTDANHKGNRHQIALLGWCEHCGKDFNLTFKQHKGTGLGEALDGAARLQSPFPWTKQPGLDQMHDHPAPPHRPKTAGRVAETAA